MTRSVNVLSSAARTTTQTSDDYTNDLGCKGILVYLNVTVADGSGGLQVQVQGIDPQTGSAVAINALPTAVVATGAKAYLIYPGASSAYTAAYSGVLPNKFNLKVTVGGSQSYTYSLSYVLIP